MGSEFRMKFASTERHRIAHAFRITIILREGKQVIHEIVEGNEKLFDFPDELQFFEPIGNLQSKYYHIVPYGDYYYIMIFLAKDSVGYFQGVYDRATPWGTLISILSSAENELGQALLSANEKEVYNIQGDVKTIVPNFELISNMKQGDGILFNLLAKKKQVLIGSDNYLQVLYTIIACLPEEYQKNCSVTINREIPLSTDFIVYTAPEFLDEERFNAYATDENTNIVDFTENICYATHTSDLTTKLFSLLSDPNLFSQKFDELLHLADDLREYRSSHEIAAKYNIPLPDADVIFAFHKNYIW